jgi:hypothetical protein
MSLLPKIAPPPTCKHVAAIGREAHRAKRRVGLVCEAGLAAPSAGVPDPPAGSDGGGSGVSPRQLYE